MNSFNSVSIMSVCTNSLLCNVYNNYDHYFYQLVFFGH